MTTAELTTEIQNLKECVWSNWERALKLIRQICYDDRVLFKYSIKSPTIDIIDSITGIEKELKRELTDPDKTHSKTKENQETS